MEVVMAKRDASQGDGAIAMRVANDRPPVNDATLYEIAAEVKDDAERDHAHVG